MRKDIARVLTLIKTGETIKFYSNIYGERSVAFKTGWLLRKTVNVALEGNEIETLKEALRQRRREMVQPD